ncbi:MAG: ATP synthase F0 subunit A [Chitinophagaceae bacterium]|nr:MAG: ATP synthase F0 subunit A [Chitinophagaceae bacterium]
MAAQRIKSLLVAVFSLGIILFSNNTLAQGHGAEGAAHEPAEKLDPAKIIMDHIKDAHEFHFFTIGDFHATIPLPVILYSPTKGLSVFSSARFDHGHTIYNGYEMKDGNITAADGSAVYDFSLTKNVVQMIIALIVLVLLMTGIAKKYKNGQGVTSAPKGWQNAVEPVITFVRDEVAKPNLGKKAGAYLPYLLTVFFFILINNLFGLIPGAANVTGNTAFTMVLGLVSLVVILASTNSHFWGHIFWPPGVPIFVKVILIPIELLGVLVIKPAALIIRLFANMVAGHIIILSFISLIFIFGAMSSVAGWGFSPISVLFTVFIYFIELLVAFIQAFIFTNLTAVFIGQSFEGGHDDVDGHQEPIVA